MSKRPSETAAAEANTSLVGKRFLVTGSAGGLGLASVERLLERGARVIVSARSEERAADVLKDLRARYPDREIAFLALDVADLRSVVRASDALLARGEPLDVLMNNAGIAGFRGLSPQGFEITFATNHLGPYLLTERLLPLLRAAPVARIVNVASVAHRHVWRIDWDKLETPIVMPLARFRRYGLTKLMNILHVGELARRLADTRITTYAAHPGVVSSDIWRKLPPIVEPLSRRFMTPIEEGVKTQVFCATDASIAEQSGGYYVDCREAQTTALAQDPDAARRLFEVSDEMIRRALHHGRNEKSAPATGG